MIHRDRDSSLATIDAWTLPVIGYAIVLGNHRRLPDHENGGVKKGFSPYDCLIKSFRTFPGQLNTAPNTCTFARRRNCDRHKQAQPQTRNRSALTILSDDQEVHGSQTSRYRSAVFRLLHFTSVDSRVYRNTYHLTGTGRIDHGSRCLPWGLQSKIIAMQRRSNVHYAHSNMYILSLGKAVIILLRYNTSLLFSLRFY
jgi:hypothetical protein